jgi:chemotaxis protein CheC
MTTVMAEPMRLLAVRAGGKTWALPLGAVEQTFDLSSTATCRIGPTRGVLFRGDVLELHDLASALGIEESGTATAGVALWAGGRRRVFAVESLVGQVAVEIQPLPELSSSPTATAVVLLDDEIVPVLDPGAVAGEHRGAGRGAVGFTEMQRSALIEVANIGSGHAATALSQLLGQPVDIRYNEALLATLAEAADRLGAYAERSAVVDTPVADDGGRVLLLLSEGSAAELCSLLQTSLDSEMGHSALSEVGNILAGSFLGAIVEMTGLELMPEPPEVDVDVLGAVVERRLNAEAAPDDPTILMRSTLTIATSDSEFTFMFVPQFTAVRSLLESLGVGDA